jgi:hypothetical protein
VAIRKAVFPLRSPRKSSSKMGRCEYADSSSKMSFPSKKPLADVLFSGADGIFLAPENVT